METTIWAIASIIFKWLIYIGTAAAIGGPFVAAMVGIRAHHRRHTLLSDRYVRAGCVLGIAAVGANFLSQAGAIPESGLSYGAMISQLWQSPVGDSVTARLLGFSSVLLASYCKLKRLSGLAQRAGGYCLTLGYLAGAALLGYSFSSVGHSADLGGLARFLLSAHVIAMGWWIGALYPLWELCNTLPANKLQTLMHSFGQIAATFVAVLTACGVVLVFLLLESPVALVTTPYGIGLSAKLITVCGILCLAALHKWRLVPQLLVNHQGVAGLRQSIATEIVLAVIVLAITAAFSTMFDPAP